LNKALLRIVRSPYGAIRPLHGWGTESVAVASGASGLNVPDSCLGLLAIEQPLNLACKVNRLCGGSETANNVAPAVDQEFCEIPFDAPATQEAGLLILQEFVKRVGMGAVHVDFGENGEADSVVLFAEGADLGGRARLLGSELVAGKAQYLESAVLIGSVKHFQAGVLRGETTFAGGIHNQENPSAEFAERRHAPIEQGRGEFINAVVRWFNHC
jgi:hypothetical protein